ncbi:MAG: hypothetical protein NVS9B7_28580 [Flavisolibacter sp.]
MKRRIFLKASFFTTTLSTLSTLAVKAGMRAEKKNIKKQFYELRVYTFKNQLQQKIVENFFQQAAIPAYNRIGMTPIGVFEEMKEEGQKKLFVIIAFDSLEDFIKSEERLSGDQTYQQAATPYLQASATAPAYERIESSLLRPFLHMAFIKIPDRKPRLFELRRYESASESAGKKKIEMFNLKGEIDIFNRVGLTPVFFGETVIGGLRPNLTYMLCFDDMEAHDRNWKSFVSDPEWKTISSIPEYADAKIVSRISSTFLIPKSFSQI